ncbi:MAG: Peptidylprolyl isomerase [Sediminibacterium sp.]|nr:Peptidylprolyl isomerase [Sediminibacterium sp.]
MKRPILMMVMGLGVMAVTAQTKKTATAATKPAAAKTSIVPVFKNNTDSVSYAVGIRIAQSLKAQGFDNVNMSLFQKAMNDVAQSKPPVLGDAAISECIGKFQQKVNSAKEAEQQKENAVKAAIGRKEGEAFLQMNSKRPGVVTLASGLQYEVIKASADNTRPVLSSRVKAHYTGTLLNGTKFDSSVDRGEPITFPLVNVIRGWQEALQLMTVGSKWKLYIPAELGYGDNPPPGAITPGATLIFEVELLGVEN